MLTPVLVLAFGCQGPGVRVPRGVERPPAAVATSRPTPSVVPASAAVPAQNPVECLDLPVLWDLTLVNNPALLEAAADVEAARGRLIQAGLYPNPRFLFANDTIGSEIARPGNAAFEFNQEIVTGGKRRLDLAVARRETDAATVGMTGRKFEALTRVRRGYYDYLALWALHQEYEESVAALDRGVEATRQQVEV